MLSANERMLCELVRAGLDDFLETEALYRVDGHFKEEYGYLRRGKVDCAHTMRKLWPSVVLRDDCIDVRWWLTYELGRRHNASVCVAVGLRLPETQFYVGLDYENSVHCHTFGQALRELGCMLAAQNYQRP